MCLRPPSGAARCCERLQAGVTLRYEGLIKGSEEYSKEKELYFL